MQSILCIPSNDNNNNNNNNNNDNNNNTMLNIPIIFYLFPNIETITIYNHILSSFFLSHFLMDLSSNKTLKKVGFWSFKEMSSSPISILLKDYAPKFKEIGWEMKDDEYRRGIYFFRLK